MQISGFLHNHDQCSYMPNLNGINVFCKKQTDIKIQQEKRIPQFSSTEATCLIIC